MGDRRPTGWSAPAPDTVRRRRRRRQAALAAVALLVVLAGIGWKLIENFQAVVPTGVYRSGQLSEGSLDSHIARYHLRSIINLRGSNPEERWYQEECALAARRGLRHYDMPTDSNYPPTAEELREWIHTLDACEKPVLIHCQSGIDRTGLVAAVALLRLDPAGSLDKARTQLSLGYGHLPWRANRDRFLAFLDLYAEWLAKTGQAHSPERVGQWATTVYVPLPEWVDHP